jgi:hypothetical protein
MCVRQVRKQVACGWRGAGGDKLYLRRTDFICGVAAPPRAPSGNGAAGPHQQVARTAMSQSGLHGIS